MPLTRRDGSRARWRKTSSGGADRTGHGLFLTLTPVAATATGAVEPTRFPPVPKSFLRKRHLGCAGSSRDVTTVSQGLADGATDVRRKNDQHRCAPVRRVEGRTGLRHPTLITWSPHRPPHTGPRMITA